MSDIAIKVENLSKRFQIGTASRPAYHRLSEAIAGAPQFLWNACRGLVPGSSIASPGSENLASDPSEFWALKDVSFEVKQGEVVGIIGRNGAGKSTLLKILSRITEPTSGRFGVRGRVASLLEVGTGFHPELTGRENIYVSGVTLGMTRAEIKKRFEEIVDFSGVEKFLDTPVKHYSSGMQVRLGFAVAAHLESEILIVDEVLAVGDAEFQKRCRSKMQRISSDGRTVVVVSHQMGMLRTLCSDAIVLKNGAIAFSGRIDDAIQKSHGEINKSGSAKFVVSEGDRLIGNEYGLLHRAWIEDRSGAVREAFDLSECVTIVMEYSVLRNVERVAVPNFHILDERDEYVFCTGTSVAQLGPYGNAPGRYRAECKIPANLLNNGRYSVGLALTCMNPGVEIAFFERSALEFQMVENWENTLKERRHGYAGMVPGSIRPDLEWSVEPCEGNAL